MPSPLTCALPLFTWKRVEAYGRKHVTPVCPAHESSEIWGIRRHDLVEVHCLLGNHLLKRCTFDEYSTEQNEAKALLYPRLAIRSRGGAL